MLYPLIPDIKHPKWIIAIKILEIIDSPRAKRMAGRLKIYDIGNFLLMIKLLVLPLEIFCKNKFKLKPWIKIVREFKKLMRISK